MARLGLDQLLAAAPRHLDTYRERTAALENVEKGIRRSELFFLYAAVADDPPVRIVESGRARAQSTLVLSSLFPEAEIISIESDATSPDVAIAAERLQARGNVECLFGDSRVLLAQVVRAGDVVLIDGPKDFRAVKLALQLLAAGKPRAVFVHDLWEGSLARPFVERHLPSVFFSDAPAWLRAYMVLDFKRRPIPPLPDARRIVYGATMGCFPAGAENFGARLFRCGVTEAMERLRVNLGMMPPDSAQVRPPDLTAVA